MTKKGFLDKTEIPGIKKIILENGINVFLEQISGREKFIFLVGFGVGSRDDAKNFPGISHFVEHIQFHSNRFRNADQITEDLESTGTDIDAATDFDSTIFWIIGYPKYFSRNIRILYEALTNFDYKEEEIELEKNQVLSELRKDLDSPEQYYSSYLFLPLLFRRTFASRPILGNPKAIKCFNRENLIAFKKKFYVPANMVIFVCGKFEEEKSVKVIEKTFGRMREKKFENKEWKIYFKSRRKEYFEKRKSLELAYAALGYKVPGFNHRDCAKFMLLDFILSGGMSSRLYKKMRNERGIGYDIGSTYEDFGGIGAFYAQITGFDSSRLKEAKEIILNEFEGLKTNLVGKQEFTRAKNLFLAKYDDDLESLRERAELLVDAYFRNDIFDCRNFKREIEKVSREALRRTAQKYFKNNYTLVALVPENFETIK